MSRKRDVLEALKRDELVDATDWFDVPVRDRRVRDDLIEALAASRKANLSGILEGLSRDRLKEVCRALDLDDSNLIPSGRDETAPSVIRKIHLEKETEGLLAEIVGGGGAAV